MAHTQGSNSYSTTIMSLPSVTGNTSIPDMTRTKMEVDYWVLMCISMERKDLSGGGDSYLTIRYHWVSRMAWRLRPGEAFLKQLRSGGCRAPACSTVSSWPHS